jgi:hypothetical protein
MTTNLLTPLEGLPSAANEFVTDLNHLARDLKSGDLTAAEQDYVLFSENLLNGASSSTATDSANGIVTELSSGTASSAGDFTAPASQPSQAGVDLQNAVELSLVSVSPAAGSTPGDDSTVGSGTSGSAPSVSALSVLA